MSNTRTTRTPAAKKAAAKRPAKPAEEPLSEQMAEEAKPTRKPAGSPNLYPFMALPRRTKAEFFRLFGHVLERKDHLPVQDEAAEQVKDDDQGKIGQLAVVYDLLADMQDGLRLAAEDPDAYDAWCNAADDQKLSDLFSWYMQRFQVGEAKASPSS